jgi:hypothetical protein
MASLFRSTARLARPSLNNNIALARSDHGEWKVGSVRFFFLSFSLARPRGEELRARCWRKARAWLLGRRGGRWRAWFLTALSADDPAASVEQAQGVVCHLGRACNCDWHLLRGGEVSADQGVKKEGHRVQSPSLVMVSLSEQLTVSDTAAVLLASHCVTTSSTIASTT